METAEFVTIAILAKDKAHVLPLYLKMIESQTYPASRIKLYIRTNNNRDNTAEILEQWMEKVRHRYSEIYYDRSDVAEPVQVYAPHEWNSLRFKVLGHIRQESVNWARERGTHYFVVDCDNFIIPETLQMLINTGMPVIGPMLRNGDDTSSTYSNFLMYKQYSDARHEELFKAVLDRTIKGVFEVEILHCTYLVRNEVLKYVNYDDGSGNFEYVIFSAGLRKKRIQQYIDNRLDYGKLTFCDTGEEFKSKNITV